MLGCLLRALQANKAVLAERAEQKRVHPKSGLNVEESTKQNHRCDIQYCGVGIGSRPKTMYGERLGDGVEYHSMKPTPCC